MSLSPALVVQVYSMQFALLCNNGVLSVMSLPILRNFTHGSGSFFISYRMRKISGGGKTKRLI